MENKFKQLLQYPSNHRKKIEYFKKLREFFTSNTQELIRTINTESNVNFLVLNVLLKTFSLPPFSKFWGRYQHPNPNLEDILNDFLRYRNGVAHGGDISSEEKVTHEIFTKYKNLILDLMYAIYDKMVYGINNESFIKKV